MRIVDRDLYKGLGGLSFPGKSLAKRGESSREADWLCSETCGHPLVTWCREQKTQLFSVSAKPTLASQQVKWAFSTLILDVPLTQNAWSQISLSSGLSSNTLLQRGLLDPTPPSWSFSVKSLSFLHFLKLFCTRAKRGH